ncbi:hypothetical protein GGR56DRAFT_479163 [Xylariaceae sp. FL0804]|nr:hypothetical protein GGR56DRAFT_479163 [Xylariaceae sp. FL0804]
MLHHPACFHRQGVYEERPDHAWRLSCRSVDHSTYLARWLLGNSRDGNHPGYGHWILLESLAEHFIGRLRDFPQLERSLDRTSRKGWIPSKDKEQPGYKWQRSIFSASQVEPARLSWPELPQSRAYSPKRLVRRPALAGNSAWRVAHTSASDASWRHPSQRRRSIRYLTTQGCEAHDGGARLKFQMPMISSRVTKRHPYGPMQRAVIH